MNKTELFTNKAELYELGRPSYPDVLLEYIQNKFNITENTYIADIGAGTGKFTEKLLDLGCYVIAVEPNQKKANELRDGLSCNQLTICERPAEMTEIEANTVDIITVAQAFHLFDQMTFKVECERMLKGSGPIILIWNSRNNAPINRETAEIFKKYCPNFNGFSDGGDEETYVSQFFDGEYHKVEFTYPLEFGLKTFVGRCASASYALDLDHPLYPQFESDIQALFESYQEDDKILVPTVTRCFYGYLKR